MPKQPKMNSRTILYRNSVLPNYVSEYVGIIGHLKYGPELHRFTCC